MKIVFKDFSLNINLAFIQIDSSRRLFLYYKKFCFNFIRYDGKSSKVFFFFWWGVWIEVCQQIFAAVKY